MTSDFKSSLNKNQTVPNLMTSTAIGLIDSRNKSSHHYRQVNSKAFPQCFSSHEFGDQNVPLRGTFYKSQNGLTGGTWINNSFGQPYFAESTTAFSVNKSQKVKKEDGLKISRETLERLASTRP